MSPFVHVFVKTLKTQQSHGAEPSPKPLPPSPHCDAMQKKYSVFPKTTLAIPSPQINELQFNAVKKDSISGISIWTSGEGVGSLRYFTNPRAFPFKENPSHMVSRQRQKIKKETKRVLFVCSYQLRRGALGCKAIMAVCEHKTTMGPNH